MARSEDPHVCDRCGARFPRATTLERHVASRHSARARAGSALKVGGALAGLAVLAALVVALTNAPQGPAPGLNLDGEPKLGNDTAPVVFVMFEDPNCPFCKRFHDQSFQALVDEFVTTGQVQMFFKENSGGNPWSLEGAYAQECAYRLGGDDAFWAITANFYRDQFDITAAPGSPRDRVRAFALPWAGELGLDPEAYARCYDNSEPRDEVAADYADARAVGARGTPSFIVKPRVGGEPVLISGAQPLSVFQTNIRTALSHAAAAGQG